MDLRGSQIFQFQIEWPYVERVNLGFVGTFRRGEGRVTWNHQQVTMLTSEAGMGMLIKVAYPVADSPFAGSIQLADTIGPFFYGANGVANALAVAVGLEYAFAEGWGITTSLQYRLFAGHEVAASTHQGIGDTTQSGWLVSHGAAALVGVKSVMF